MVRVGFCRVYLLVAEISVAATSVEKLLYRLQDRFTAKQIRKTNKMFCNYGATANKQVRGKRTNKSVASKQNYGATDNKIVCVLQSIYA